MKLLKILGSMFLLGMFLLPAKLQATHIVGGELTYRCIANWTFEVTLTVRRDCEYGSDEAQFDNIASIGIFDSNGELLPWLGTGGQLLINYNGDDTLNSTLIADCDFLGEAVCVQKAVYRDTITLPFRPGGYILAYQRCCRNETLTNIIDPVETGSTYLVRITNKASVECNSTPTFNEDPALYVCANEDLVADMSVTEPDGDSIVYRLCTPYTGASLDFPFPQPPKQPLTDEVEFVEGYGVDNFMGGTPLRIDPNTGILTGTPNLIGQFLVGVCVDEYRDGELISTIKRDFEYNVRECIQGPEAMFTVEDEPECDGLEVVFTNTSIESDAFEWFFDWPNIDSAFTSTEENPTFTYPANGIYTIKLIATRSSDGCFDEFFKNLGVYDSMLEASFTTERDLCEGDSITYTLTSTSVEPDTNFTIIGHNWVVTGEGFMITESGEEVTITVPNSGDISATLTVTSSNGCTADTTVSVLADDTPLESSFIFEILGCPGDSTTIMLTSTSVEPDPRYTIDSWNWFANFDNFTFTDSGEEIIVTVPRVDSLIVSLTVTSSNGCSANVIDTIDVDPIDIPPPFFEHIICPGDTILLLEDTNDGLVFTWEPTEGLIFPDGDSTMLPYFTLAEGQTSANYQVTVTAGACSVEGEGNVFLNETPEPEVLDFTKILECGTTTVCFENISVPEDGNYIFDFGDLASEVDTSTEGSICYTYPDFGTYMVSLEYLDACEEYIVTKEVAVVPDLTISLPEEQLFCPGATVDLVVEPIDDITTAVWTDESGEIVGEGAEISFEPVGDQLITVIATNAGGCMDTASIFLDEYAFDYSIDAPEVACKDEDTTIGIIDNTGDNFSYVWNPESGIVGDNTGATVTININVETEFSVTITNDDNGCTSDTTVVVPVSDVSAEVISDPEEVYQCNPAEIGVLDPDPNYTYEWNTGNTGPTFTSDTLLQDETFTVTVTDEFGCTAVASKTVTVLLPNCDESDVFLPTAFTPNGDNINDILKVESNFVKSMELLIYTRWGQLVFSSNNQDDGWDGNFEGTELAPDVYAYQLNVTCSNGANYTSVGNITLIR